MAYALQSFPPPVKEPAVLAPGGTIAPVFELPGTKRGRGAEPGTSVRLSCQDDRPRQTTEICSFGPRLRWIHLNFRQWFFTFSPTHCMSSFSEDKSSTVLLNIRRRSREPGRGDMCQGVMVWRCRRYQDALRRILGRAPQGLRRLEISL